MSCIFCKIVNGDLPCYKIYEDRRFLGFLDINPINKGHVLIIPKDHYDNLSQTPVDVLKDLIALVRSITPAVVAASGAEGFNLVVNNGKVAGQLIDHVHFHIIPRFKNDHLHPWPGQQYQRGEIENFTKRIIKALEE